jgi:hypothetical protein
MMMPNSDKWARSALIASEKSPVSYALQDIPALNVAYNRSLSKSLYCHLTPLEPCTEASQKSSVMGRVGAGMALIAALSSSRRHSSARPAFQPRCTGRDIHSP